MSDHLEEQAVPSVLIYALIDGERRPRYVGQTKLTLHQRLQRHLSLARSGRWDRDLDRWLRSDDSVSITILRHCVSSDADECERFWIAWFRQGGENLFNISRGGKRGGGFPHTDAAKAKVSAARKGKPLSGEHRQKLADAHRGVALSEEHRAAIARGGKGRIASEETRRRMSDSKRGDRNPMSASRRAEREGRVIGI